jgi:predicted ABC-type ATPase
MKKQIITIDGIDGANKSTFARNLLASLERAGRLGVVVRADILIDDEVPQAPRVLRCDVSRVAEPLRSILERLLPAAAA